MGGPGRDNGEALHRMRRILRGPRACRSMPLNCLETPNAEALPNFPVLAALTWQFGQSRQSDFAIGLSVVRQEVDGPVAAHVD